MALVSSTLKPAPAPQPVTKNTVTDIAAPLLSMVVVSLLAAQKSKKEFRKLKRRFVWNAMKLKAKAFFSRRAEGLSRNTIIYILLGVALIVLLITAPIVALVLAIIALILLLTKTI